MKEDCFCGGENDLEYREPVFDRDGERALRCPGCGHMEYLRWLPNDIRLLVLEDEFNLGLDRYAERSCALCKPSSNNTVELRPTPRAKE